MSSAHADRRADREPEHRAAQARVVAAGEQEQRDVRGAHDPVGAARTRAPRSLERVRHAQRHDQQRRHRREHHEPDRALLGVDDAREPGVAGPRPPQQREHEHALAPAAPSVGVRRAISAVHWVIASTKTRSKKSSSGVTRSPSRNGGLRRVRCAASFTAGRLFGHQWSTQGRVAPTIGLIRRLPIRKLVTVLPPLSRLHLVPALLSAALLCALFAFPAAGKQPDKVSPGQAKKAASPVARTGEEGRRPEWRRAEGPRSREEGGEGQRPREHGREGAARSGEEGRTGAAARAGEEGPRRSAGRRR